VRAARARTTQDAATVPPGRLPSRARALPPAGHGARGTGAVTPVRSLRWSCDGRSSRRRRHCRVVGGQGIRKRFDLGDCLWWMDGSDTACTTEDPAQRSEEFSAESRGVKRKAPTARPAMPTIEPSACDPSLFGLDPQYWCNTKLFVRTLLKLPAYSNFPGSVQLFGHPLRSVQLKGCVVRLHANHQRTLFMCACRLFVCSCSCIASTR
jgi:hypothetical protein